MPWKFEVYLDAGNNYRWRLNASNGLRVAAAGEAFDGKSNAERAARGFKASAKTAAYTAFKGAGTEQWYWHAKAANGAKIAVGGEGFVSKQTAETAYANVRENAGSAVDP